MTDKLLGQQLSNYRIERVIGQGGMATVYYGWDSSLERPVAIKIVDERFRSNPAYAQRFVQEARTMATLRHENILQVFYAGQEETLSYFAMEFVDGPDLGQVMRQYIDDGELMPHEDVVRLGRAIAAALDYAHGRQVIHRDVKPSNVMIAKDGRIVLADFGLALNTQQGSMGEIFGTPHYIAPEQARNSAMAVAQSDLYSLGVILYEMLTGVVPFDDPSPTSLALQHLTQPPPNPREINSRLNETTEQMLLKALSKEPSERYQTGADLVAALAEALDQPETAVSGADSDLPPLPNAVTPPALSQKSVAERVSFFLPPPPPTAETDGYSVQFAPAPPPASATPAPSSSQQQPPTATTAATKKKPPWGMIAVGAAVVLFLLFFGGRSLLGGNEDESPNVDSNEPDPVLVDTEVPVIKETEVVTEEAESETAVAPAETESAIAVEEPTTEPETVAVEAPTEAPLPTETAVIEPDPTEVPIAEATAEVVPTILYPNGHRLELIYNLSSLYVFNASSEQVRVTPLKFEALNADGQSVGYSFDGYRWSQFYSFVDDNNCVSLEISDLSNYLRPGKCRDFNSRITPPEGDPEIFWLEQAGATQFRILWEDQEVARCPITSDFCEVFVP